MKGALATPWNPWMARSLRHAVTRLKPDVVHVHNTFPLISPGIFHALAGTGAARVLTLHNYRLFCPAGIPMRRGKVCTDCLDARTPLPALKHGCYRDSQAATLPLALSVGFHRAAGTWTRQVDAFIALSDFQRQRMAVSGLPLGKVHVKPNFYPGSPTVLQWNKRQPYVVFVGRLTAEKGITNLLRAWAAWGAAAPELRLVGDGPLRPGLEKLAKGLPVRFLGQLPAAQAQAEIAASHLLVLPSEWFEGFPMVVREAFGLTHLERGNTRASHRFGRILQFASAHECGRWHERILSWRNRRNTGAYSREDGAGLPWDPSRRNLFTTVQAKLFPCRA